MKKVLNIMLALLMLIPFMHIKASTKTDALIEMLKEQAKTYEGTVTYENDEIQIEWFIPNSKLEQVSFLYNENIIEYNPGEITSYEEASESMSHTFYATELIRAALIVNGYSDEEVKDFFNSEDKNFDYDINGIEFKSLGEAEQFISSDGTSTLTVAPISIKIDVAKANLNSATDPAFVTKSTTVEDVVNYLNNDEDFASTKDNGKTIFENEVSIDDDTLTIDHTFYWEDYYNVSFYVEDDVISYEDEIIDYFDAERALSHQMYMRQIIVNALKINGYTTEQINNFFSSETNEFNYDVNGIEIKQIGETKEYFSDNGDSISIEPMSYKIDLKRANLNKYKVLEGENQKISNDKELTFRLNIDYAVFKEEGKVYVDGKLVDSSNYTSKEGSTIITFNSNYVKTLSNKEHTLKVAVNDGEVLTHFTIDDANTIKNPNTGDNILVYIILFGLSIVGFVLSKIYFNKKRFN